MFAHRPLGLTGRAGCEVNVCKLIRRDSHAEIAVSMSLCVYVLDDDSLHLIKCDSVIAFGEYVVAVCPKKHSNNAVSWKVRLDGQIHATGFEDCEHSDQPVQITFSHNTYNSFAG